MPKTTQPAEPRNLYEACLQHELQRHHRRIAELKRMQARLALLDAMVPGLKARGVDLSLERVTDHGGKDLYLTDAGSIFSGSGREKRLVDALVAEGMTEVERRNCGPIDSVTLAKGRLRVRVASVPAQVAPAAPASAQPSAPAGTQFFATGTDTGTAQA